MRVLIPTTLLILAGSTLCVAAEPAASRPFGTDRRVPWTASRVIGSPEAPPPYRAEKSFPKLKIKQPLTFEREPGSASYLVIQHLGSWSPPAKLLRVADDPEVDSYQTLLEFDWMAYGLDFHPDYVKNGYLYLGQNRTTNGAAKTRVSRFTVGRRPPHAIDPKSELVIIEWESNGHNGGDVAFGNDGMLYVSAGDGTSDSDINLRGQDLTHLTAKILRIDVDHPDPGKAYSVPKDNPFLQTPGARPETWAYGVRNPWRLSYDKATGQLWCGNNGQDLWESAFLIEKGANYGWSVNEGSHAFQPKRTAGPTPFSPPTVEHHHSEARSLTGGVVYHGKDLPEIRGAYVYGDWSTGKIWAVRVERGHVVYHREIADTALQITGFGIDSRDELVVIDHVNGFHRLVPTEQAADAPPFPRRLSETGLFDSVRNRLVNPGLIPYSVNSPLWSDGARKERYIAVPGDAKVGFTTGGNGWNFPEGTVLVKTFLLDLAGGDPGAATTPRPIETRLFTRQQGEWAGYTYVWNDEGTDAVLGGKDGLDRVFSVRDPAAPGGVRQQTWRYPSRAECLVCHSRAANFVLGLSELQMNRVHDYGNGVSDNQIRTLALAGLFADPLPKSVDQLDRLVNPADSHASLDLRVRSYLHSNCANCHVEAGGGNAAVNLAYGAKLGAMRVVDIPPMQETFGIDGARIVSAGHPERSTLLERMKRRGAGQMPPLATSRVDEDAVKLLQAWITSLSDTPEIKSKARTGLNR